MINIDWKPDRNSSIQLHIQIANYIKNKIATDEWPIGYKLPSQRILAELFDVNRSTIVAAIEELKSEDLLQGNTGGGTKVIGTSLNLLSLNNIHNWNNSIYSGLHQANQNIMQQINAAEFNPKIIKMGSCEPSPELIANDIIQNILGKMSISMPSLGYEEPKGSIALRKEISKYLKTLNIDADPSSILITSGVLQAIQLISFGLLQSNSRIYLEKPSYLYSLRTFQSLGMQCSGISIDDEGINLEELVERNKKRKGSMLFSIPTFQNPTGNVMSLTRRKELISICESEHLPIVEDDVYRELWIDFPPPAPIKSLDKNNLVLYTGGLSKNLSPGLRIGWVVGPEKVIDRLADIKMQTDYGSSSLSQNVAAEIFSSGLYYEHNNIIREKVKLRRDVTINALNKYFSGIATWDVPAGGYFIWLKLYKNISMNELFIKALKNKILIFPGDLYEFHSSNYVRISYSYAKLEELEYGIKTLSELIINQL